MLDFCALLNTKISRWTLCPQQTWITNQLNIQHTYLISMCLADGLRNKQYASAFQSASMARNVGFESEQLVLSESTSLFAGSAWEQHFVRQVIELHDKYMLYVGGCFANSSLFHKALKEAFEFFCNKNVAGSSTAELMANFCDNLLRKVCNADGR